MFFGKTTFAEDSFASQGIKDVSVSVTPKSYYDYWHRNSDF